MRIGIGNGIGVSNQFKRNSVFFSDYFNREDNATSLGSPWVSLGLGNWGVTGGKAYCASTTAGQNDIVCVDAGKANIQIDVDLYWSGSYGGVVFRASDISNYYYIFAEPAGGVRLGRTLGGSFTDLGAFASKAKASNHVTIQAIDTSVKITWNGELLYNLTNMTDLSSGTKHGLFKYDANNSARWDNFVVT